MRKRVLITFALLAGTACAFVAWIWRTEDSIGRAVYRTEWLLLTHRVVDRSDELRDWITKYHGEAPDMAVMMRFVEWSIDHPEAAEEVVAGLSAVQLDEVATEFGWSVHDSGQDAEFAKVFANRKSPFFQRALQEMERLGGMSSNHAIQPSVWSVTVRAKSARTAPAHPAADRGRWAD